MQSYWAAQSNDFRDNAIYEGNTQIADANGDFHMPGNPKPCYCAFVGPSMMTKVMDAGGSTGFAGTSFLIRSVIRMVTAHFRG